ncbi:hypothetical protein [Ewingella americana]|uniref:hypothetical protein n=1 Tax=Ewingella americana TaxID=41202 RepID=UPI001F1DAB98|nr:hypothetical protein [Ewingella americana]
MTIKSSDINKHSGLINSARLWESVNQLATMTLPNTPWTRRAFTPLFSDGRRWLQLQMELAGLDVTLDAGAILSAAELADVPGWRRSSLAHTAIPWSAVGAMTG